MVLKNNDDGYSDAAKVEGAEDRGNVIVLRCLTEKRQRKVTVLLMPQAKELVKVGDRIVLGYCDGYDDIVLAISQDGRILPLFPTVSE
jgi:CobQ-like glutamine amidotransferase family enzyme